MQNSTKMIKYFSFILLVSLNLFSTAQSDSVSPQVSSVMSKEEIKAGLKSHNKALFIKEHWIRDPYIILGPDDFYYLTGTTPNPGDEREQTDPYNIGLRATSIVGSKVQIWRSKDLIEWDYLGTPYSLNNTYQYLKDPNSVYHPKHEKQKVLWAPELHWTGKNWALVHCPKHVSNLVFSAGREIDGSWTYPMKGAFSEKHDPSLFQDNDGTWYALWGNTYVARLSNDFSTFTSDATHIPPSGNRPDPENKNKHIQRIGHEGATMRKIGGKYVSFGTAWSTDLPRQGSYNLYYCVADKITGPYGQRKFAGRFLGHGTPFQTRDGKWWCTAFFNGNIPPVSTKEIQTRDLSETAQTINRRGTTIVPLEVKILENGDIYIRAKDPDYARPGPDENQKFILD